MRKLSLKLNKDDIYGPTYTRINIRTHGKITKY